jgi:hypothetical protein
MASTPSTLNIRKNKSYVGPINKVISPPEKKNNCQKQKICVCSPTNHPGSFRCSLHKGMPDLKNNSTRKAVAENSPMNKVPTVVVKLSTSEKNRYSGFQLQASLVLSFTTDDL